MTVLSGKLHAETPIYRGNARKTLFTRDGDGTQRLVSLAGEIQGTAQSLMDAFIGQSSNGRNMGLLNRLWLRLYGISMPADLVSAVDCKLRAEAYPSNHFFDLRMGMRLDEDRWASEANANYKYETLLRNSVFDFHLTVNDRALAQGENQARLYYLLQELSEGRFWFGAGKSKGLGRVRLELDTPLPPPQSAPRIAAAVNHLQLSLTFDASNPVLVGWTWGKVDPEMPSYAAIEGQSLVSAMRGLPEPIKKRLEMGLGGPITTPEEWKHKLSDTLPRVIAIWLRERSVGESEIWIIPSAALNRQAKGKYPLSAKVISAVQPLTDKPFANQREMENALNAALADHENMFDRIFKITERRKEKRQQLDRAAWQEIASALGLDVALETQLSPLVGDEAALSGVLAEACQGVLSQLFEQVDQQVNLIRSDAWVDAEIASRDEHLRIKRMLMEGKINESQWLNRNSPPAGVSAAGWREFLDAHRQVRFQHMLGAQNLRKSIVNDQNFIAFLKDYRETARQEMAQSYNLDFRRGGPGGKEISRTYGKPYDTVFTRMLSWSPSASEQGMWEIYIPGGTLKGAFRRRASQTLKTVWGETPRTRRVIDRLFGIQGQRGLILFSDAYLSDPLDPERAWCSMDGIRMDARTGRPVETAKSDYLFAYGSQLTFNVRLDLQDVTEQEAEALNVFLALLNDFRRGDIPLGGEKTAGFGWVQGEVARLTWLSGNPAGMTTRLFAAHKPSASGVWHKIELEGEAAAAVLRPTNLMGETVIKSPELPRSEVGFVSHRSFGGRCGMLVVEAETLTPLHVSESGEPSYQARLEDGMVYGWDFFSMSPAQADRRAAERRYALPSKSLRGMLRHIYTIASDSAAETVSLSNLNPADSLFGWVGKGRNQSIMGRLSINFGMFTQPQMAWFKVPYPYGKWQFKNGKWQNIAEASAASLKVANTWRLFPHTPLAPIVQQVSEFAPTSAQASYLHAILPGNRARFTVRFWNLGDEELQRLVWCVALENQQAHKLGNHRYLGMGSLRLRLLPGSYLIDWGARYAGKAESEWQCPLQLAEWLNPKVIAHYRALSQYLNADAL